jgi:FkbM family methyltransferase
MALQRGHVFLGANALVWLLGVWYVAMLRSSLIRDEDLARRREEQLSAALMDAVQTNKQTIATHAQVLEQMRLGCGGAPLAAAPPLAGAAAPAAAVCPPCPAVTEHLPAPPPPPAPPPAAGGGGGSVEHSVFTTEGYTFAEDGSFVLGMKLWKADPVTHMLKLPPEVKRVWVDVGTHAQAGVTRPFLNTETDLFIIGFEPNHFQWGEIATSPDPSKTHDWGKGHPKFWAIHAAASEENGYATFHRSSSNMCSSLNDMTSRMEGTDCGKVQEEFVVNVLALETVLKLVPPEVRIEFVKIDAQGHDLSVAKGLKSVLPRVEHVMLECQVKAMYEGSATQKDVVEWFESNGWAKTADENNGLADEINMAFTNTAMNPPHDGVAPLKLHGKDAPWLMKSHVG